jgi:hypothetical protein
MNLVGRIAQIFGLAASRQPTGKATSGLNGRRCVETSWPGKECSAWIPDTDENGGELTFATRAEANSYRYNVRKDGWVVQINRWVLPPEPAEDSQAKLLKSLVVPRVGPGLPHVGAEEKLRLMSRTSEQLSIRLRVRCRGVGACDL